MLGAAIERGAQQRARLRGRAAPRRGARRARPRQDDVLQQREPRVPHAADADAGPARGRRWRTRSEPLPPASASGSSSSTATRCGCSSWSTRCSTSRASRPAACEARFQPTDLAALTRRSGERVPLRDREARASRFLVDCAAARRAGLRRSRHVGEDRPQPALERVQVHVRRARSRVALRGARRHARADACATPAPASRRPSCRACSSASTASRARTAAATRAAASAWRWSRSW